MTCIWWTQRAQRTQAVVSGIKETGLSLLAHGQAAPSATKCPAWAGDMEGPTGDMLSAPGDAYLVCSTYKSGHDGPGQA